jgi:hypothetical protein
MWEPRRLITLWASTACYSDIFTFSYSCLYGFLHLVSLGSCVESCIAFKQLHPSRILTACFLKLNVAFFVPIAFTESELFGVFVEFQGCQAPDTTEIERVWAVWGFGVAFTETANECQPFQLKLWIKIFLYCQPWRNKVLILIWDAQSFLDRNSIRVTSVLPKSFI